MGSGVYATGGQMENNGGGGAGILLAGGRGARAGFSTNKAYVEIGGTPMLSYSLRTLDRSPWVERLALVIRPEDREVAERMVDRAGTTTPLLLVEGGSSRHRSEARGLKALSGEIRDGGIDLVAIHDGARPFLSPDLLDRLFRLARRHGGAIPTLGLETPTYRVSKNGDLVALPPDRLHRAQTPQVFSAPELLSAYRRARRAGFEGVDTAETVERFSDLKIRTTAGDPGNLKLTFPEDFETGRLPWRMRG